MSNTLFLTSLGMLWVVTAWQGKLLIALVQNHRTRKRDYVFITLQSVVIALLLYINIGFMRPLAGNLDSWRTVFTREEITAFTFLMTLGMFVISFLIPALPKKRSVDR